MEINSKTIRPGLKYFGIFNDAFRKHVHILIAWGYRNSLLRIKSDTHVETVITGYISEAIINRLRAFDCPGWCTYYSVMENKPVERQGLEGEKRPKPDLIIESKIKGRPEYVFEAKRLKKNGFGTGEYLGENGLGRFISGKYAARYDEAAMLGYIQSDSPMHWQTEIQEKINQNKANLNLISIRENIKIINDLPDEWLSVHNRKGMERLISIFHILLDFRTN